MHADQVDVDAALVRDLVAAQFPRWADLPVTDLPSAATVNAVFRLGEELVVRLPLRAEAARQVPAEHAAARELLGRTRFPTPQVVAAGEPGAGYPFAWTVARWIAGTPADEVDTTALDGLALDVAEFVRGVRDLPLHDRRFSGTGRGGDLHAHDAWVGECLDRSAGLLDVGALRALWARYRVLPHVSADVVTHGDLVPGNLLVADGRLAGVLDVGGLGPADPALDLIAGWHLFDGPARERFRTACAVEDLDWVRGQAWAFQQSVGLVQYYERTNPRMSSLGRRTLERVLADPLV
ncbi:aminoglycoside phosphotransferase family protein [Kineococcus aurantiacus]|uniref:aminoglycoside phosphotransferase family protein n=1 Tax=Kineococcus aurantiacus TaxID=37633 RepID=UPI0015C95BC3|nr:aminoglycoside phosphotransferase family protein [Kineococcus aurantiacus]